jgi:O-antigen/teichoic acid export membrane protein
MTAISKLRSLATGSAAIMASRLAGAGVGFLTQFLLVRIMGAHDLGLFYSASSLAAVLGVVVAQGYPQIAARFIGRYRNKKNDGLAGRFTGHAMREGLIAATIAAALITLAMALWPGIDGNDRIAYAIAGWMLLAIASLNISTNVAGGMRAFALCYMPEGLLRPILFFVTVGALGLVGVKLTGDMAMLIFALITGAMALTVWTLLRRIMPPVNWMPASQAGLSWRWRKEGWQLLLMAVFTNFFADVGILVVLPFLTKPEIALFGLCLKLALLVGYFVQIGQQMAVPDMADARHHGDTPRIRRAAWRSIAGPTLVCMAALVVVAPFGDFLLSQFGTAFAAGGGVLTLLVVSQLIRALFGPGVHMLTLRGNQGVNMALSFSALIVFAIASALLCPAYGTMGAAFAVLIVQIYWNGACAVALRVLEEPAMDSLWMLMNRPDMTPRLALSASAD